MTRVRGIVLTLLAVLILAEGGTRLALWIGGDAYSAKDARQEIVDIASAMNDRVAEGEEARRIVRSDAPEKQPFLHPFLGWTSREVEARLASDVERYGNGARPEGEVLVMVVGGSVSAKFARHGSEHLRAKLEAETGRAVRFINYGMGAYKQPQQLHAVCGLLALGLVPDVVLNIDGFNEVAASSANTATGTHPNYPAANFWLHLYGSARGDRSLKDKELRVFALQRAAAREADEALGDGAMHSAVLGALRRSDVRRLRAEWVRAVDDYTSALGELDALADAAGPPFDPQGVKGTIVRNWVESSRSLDAACRARGIVYVHVLQPTLTDPGTKPLTPEEEAIVSGATDRTTFVPEGYPALRAAAADLTAEGVRFVDATDTFARSTETIYRDVCHYNRAGNVALADRLYENMLAALRDRTGR
ncbi:MAG: hypothetical protein AAF726_11015 [Planctomycetota bacterium]